MNALRIFEEPLVEMLDGEENATPDLDSGRAFPLGLQLHHRRHGQAAICSGVLQPEIVGSNIHENTFVFPGMGGSPFPLVSAVDRPSAFTVLSS